MNKKEKPFAVPARQPLTRPAIRSRAGWLVYFTRKKRRNQMTDKRKPRSGQDRGMGEMIIYLTIMRNSQRVNIKTPAEHVSPASKERVQQVGHYPEGIWIRPDYHTPTRLTNFYALMIGFVCWSARTVAYTFGRCHQ